MRTDQVSYNNASQAGARDYWDVPEIAALLQIVTHINIGGTLALCIWLVMLAFGNAAKPAVTGNTALNQQGCRCERMVLIPIPPSTQQLARFDRGSRS